MQAQRIALTFGVCVEGVMPQPESEHEFTDPHAAVEKAIKIKQADPDSLVTVCLWEAD